MRVQRFLDEFCLLVESFEAYLCTDFPHRRKQDSASCSSAAVLPCTSTRCFQKAREESYSEITERNRRTMN